MRTQTVLMTTEVLLRIDRGQNRDCPGCRHPTLGLRTHCVMRTQGMPQRGRGCGGVRYEYGRYTGGVRYVLVTREPTVTRETTDATDGVGGVAPEFTQSDGRRLTLLLLQERRKTWDLRQRLTAAEERTAKAKQRLTES